MRANLKVEFGDFQTPQALAGQVCALLVRRHIIPDLVLEPTCGVGSFLVAAAQSFSRAQLFGWDINGDYVEQARAALREAGAAGRSTVARQDFFKHDWERELAGFQGEILILGNLPWVTNAAVSSLNGANLPDKQNFQGFRGLAARTGKSNFDISEWMLIELIKSLRGRRATIAILCKTAIARKLLRFAWQNDGRISAASLHRIDARKHFEAAVDACLLLAQTGSAGPAEAAVFDDLEAQWPGISTKAPLTWNYLCSHRSLFEARKSSIYASRIPFALFGIGDYSFAPWKVAISGFHKKPRFIPVASWQDKPVFFDDACYFLPFQSLEETEVVAEILNSEPCLRFISSLLFEDSKRPITVELLQRLNLYAIAEEAGLADKWASVRNQRSFHPLERLDLQPEFLMERPAS
jgi:hypothetical protein